MCVVGVRCGHDPLNNDRRWLWVPAQRSLCSLGRDDGGPFAVSRNPAMRCCRCTRVNEAGAIWIMSLPPWSFDSQADPEHLAAVLREYFRQLMCPRACD